MRKAGLWLAALAIVVFVVGASVFAGCGGDTTTTARVHHYEAPADYHRGVRRARRSCQPGKLIVGSDTSFPPMESMNGTIAEGFDVDLMAAIAKKLGLEMVFKTEIFDTLIPTLKAGGKFDIIASSMTITDERKKEIDFSDSVHRFEPVHRRHEVLGHQDAGRPRRQEDRRPVRHHRARHGPPRT